MHQPKLLRSKAVRSAMIPAVLLCLIVSGCTEQQITEPRVVSIPAVARTQSVPFNKFFTAWSQSYSSSPIETQIFDIDVRQDRQYSDIYANERLLAFARANPGRLYLHGDEPDQYCISPYDYAGMFHDFVALVRGADATARFAPGGFAEPNYYCCPPPGEEPCMSTVHSVGYADQFYNAYIQRYGVKPPVAEWRFHDFGLSFASGDVNGWWSRVDKEAAWAVAHGAPMVLGGWGFFGWSEPAPLFQEHLKQAMGRLMNDARIIGAVYWTREKWGAYTTHYLVDADGSLTPAGQTFVNPLTDIPTGLKIVGSANGQAKLRWSNTTSAWAAEVEFWVQSSGSNSFVYQTTERVAGPGASQTAFVTLKVGDRVKARVRYYNVYGQAPWSQFSNTVLLALTGTEGHQGGVGKSPLICFLRLC
jgi:hypothetical protein